MAIYEEPFWQYSSSMAAPQIPWEPHGSVPDGAAQFLAAGRVAHLALLDGNPPIAVPFRYHFDPAQPGRLYLHGPAASLALRLAASGARASVTVLLLDGVVGSRSAMNSPVRYRSVVCLGRGRAVAEGLGPAIYQGMLARYDPSRAAGGDPAARDAQLDSALVVEIAIEAWRTTPV